MKRALLLVTLVLLGSGGVGVPAFGVEPANPVGAPSPLAGVDTALPDYVRVTGLSGQLVAVGSDTMANLMAFWGEGFRRIYPGVRLHLQASGSSTAPVALVEGTANIAPMSRMMKPEELRAFERRFGYPPMAVGVAIDTLAIFVHRDNPIAALSLAQVDAIFSGTRRCGSREPIESWGDLGLTGSWARRPIQTFGRNSVSGTYGYFKQHALCKGDFSPRVNEQPGSASVVQSVGASPHAIGYSGYGFRTAGVRAVPLSFTDGEPAVAPSQQTALSGEYPLTRLLYIYVNNPPEEPLPLLVRELFSWILSRQGQQIVLKDGYVPLPASVAAQQRALVTEP